MIIYDPIAEALNLTPLEVDLNDLIANMIEGVDYIPYKQPPPWNKGILRTEEQKRLQSEKMKGRKRSKAACEAISKGKLGKKRKPFSEETKRKISEAAKRQWENSKITGAAVGRKAAINRTTNKEF